MMAPPTTPATAPPTAPFPTSIAPPFRSPPRSWLLATVRGGSSAVTGSNPLWSIASTVHSPRSFAAFSAGVSSFSQPASARTRPSASASVSPVFIESSGVSTPPPRRAIVERLLPCVVPTRPVALPPAGLHARALGGLFDERRSASGDGPVLGRSPRRLRRHARGAVEARRVGLPERLHEAQARRRRPGTARLHRAGAESRR